MLSKIIQSPKDKYIPLSYNLILCVCVYKRGGDLCVCVYERKRERGGGEEGDRVMKLERGQEKVKRDLNMGENHEKK